MNTNLFFFLFNDFIGGADNDSLSEQYANADLDNPKCRIRFILNEIKPFFESNFTTSQKDELLLMLDNLSSGKNKIKTNDFENQLFPFDTPNDIQDFCRSLKDVLYLDFK